MSNLFNCVGPDSGGNKDMEIGVTLLSQVVFFFLYSDFGPQRDRPIKGDIDSV